MRRLARWAAIRLARGTTRPGPAPSGLLGRFARDERGAIAIMFALLLPMLVGAVAIGVEAGLWFAERRNLQAAVDAGVYAAALEVAEGNTDDTYLDTVATDAAQRVVPGVSADVTYPPTSGDFAGNSNAVMVDITSTSETLFAKMFLGGTVGFDVTATTNMSSSGGSCILALHPSDDSSLLVNGTNSMNMDCGIAVTSTSSTKALDMPGTSVVDSSEICVAGGASTGGSVVFTNAEPDENCSPPSDPLASLPEPDNADDPCTYTDFKIDATGVYDIWPGVYCNGIDISATSTVTFHSGTYILAGKGLKFAGTITATGDEVFFYNTDNHGDGAFGDVDFSGTSTVRFTAPTSGTYAGVLFFDDRSDQSASTGKKFKIAGTVATDFDGAIYYPRNDIEFSGTAAVGQTCGAKLIGQHITFSGTGAFNWQTTGCASENVTIGGTPSISFVE